MYEDFDWSELTAAYYGDPDMQELFAALSSDDKYEAGEAAEDLNFQSAASLLAAGARVEDCVKVESARTVHSQAIADVHVGSWRAAYAHMFAKPFLDAMDVEDFARQWLDFIASAQGARAMFVASVDEAIVGFAAVGPYRPHDGSVADAHVGEVYAIYVDPSSWSAGVGQSLLDVAVAHLLGAGLTDIRLWMFADNHRARRFYERAGFAADGMSITETIGGGGPNATEVVEQRFHLEARST